MLRAARSSQIQSPGLDELLLSGGDGRLALDPASGLNMYGCAVRPRQACDFSSSTASSISESGYARARQAWRRVARPHDPSLLEALAEDTRAELRAHLGLDDAEADIVFAPSGTDAQLVALFLARALRGENLVSVIAGSDQTGSGTAFTAKGAFFSDGATHRKGAPIPGLAGVPGLMIPFCDASGMPRTLAQMDQAVLAAVESQVARGCAVLLQAMAASKLGWAAPSAACLDVIRQRWPDKVQIVTDACQMRIGTDRLRHILARGDLVLMTGSKFFCGPPFSGAVLVPGALRRAVGRISHIPEGLRAVSRACDWPSCWPRVRDALAHQANIGQWLRWQAALEEMRAYYAVPASFRRAALAHFSIAIPDLLSASGELHPVPHDVRDVDAARDGEFAVPSIFSFSLGRGRGLAAPACTAIYRGLNQDMSAGFSGLAAQRCHIGQPVAVGGGRTVLRLSSSARLVSACWSPDPILRAARLEAQTAKAARTIEKCVMLLRQGVQAAA